MGSNADLFKATQKQVSKQRLRVDFHCFVNLTCVNKIEAMYERSLVNEKLSEVQLLVYARPFKDRLYFI